MMGGAVQNQSNQMHQQLVYQGLGNQGQMPKQRLKSATMNKRIQRGFSREHHQDDGSNSHYDDINN